MEKRECLLWVKSGVCVVGMGWRVKVGGMRCMSFTYVSTKFPAAFSDQLYKVKYFVLVPDTCGHGETFSELFVFSRFFLWICDYLRCGAVPPCSDNIPYKLYSLSHSQLHVRLHRSSYCYRDLRTRHRDAGLPATCSFSITASLLAAPAFLVVVYLNQAATAGRRTGASFHVSRAFHVDLSLSVSRYFSSVALYLFCLRRLMASCHCWEI